MFLIYCLQPWRPKYGTMDSSILTDCSSNSLQGIVHLIYRWVVSSFQTCLPYQDFNCQQGENFSLFHQIGFLIIMTILWCSGFFHWSSWQVHITTNQKDCDKCFQHVRINGETMISLGDCISDWYLQINFIISSAKIFSNNKTGSSTISSTG